MQKLYTLEDFIESLSEIFTWLEVPSNNIIFIVHICTMELELQEYLTNNGYIFNSDTNVYHNSNGLVKIV